MVFATEFDPTDRAGRVRTTPTAPAAAVPHQLATYAPAVVTTAIGQRRVANTASFKSSSRDLKARLAKDWGDDFSDESFNDGALGNALGNVVPLNPTQPPLSVGNPAVRVRIDENKSLSLPKHPKLPFRLQLLNRLQQGSTVITTVLVTAALAVYGSTVYVDKSTSRALVQLDSLQGESQQLTSANESIKQSLAEQATQIDSGLEPYEAGDVLFLAPEPLRAGVTPPEPVADMPGPLGY